MAQYTVVTPPVGDVLSLANFKAFLRIDIADTSEDTILNLILSSVQSTFERYSGLVLQPTVFDMLSDPVNIVNVLTIAKSPVTEITSAEVLIDSVYQAVSDYDTKLGYNSHVHIINSDTDGNTHEKYKVRFTAGLSSVPDDLILAMYQHGAFAYENRGDCEITACGFPSFVLNIYNAYKVLWI